MKRPVAFVMVVAVLAVVMVIAASCAKKATQQPEPTTGPVAHEVGKTAETPALSGEVEEGQPEEEAAETPEEEAREKAEEQSEAGAKESVLPEETLNGEEVTLTNDNFDDVIDKPGVVALVDFWAEWCGPCLRQAPIVEELAKDYKGKVVVGKVNIDQARDLADRFGIQAIPTLIVFKDGKEIDRAVGLRDKGELKSMIEKALGG